MDSLDPRLSAKLRTPTPMKLTALIVAHGGCDVVGIGQNVGMA